MKERMERLDEYMKLKGLNDNQITVNCGLSQGLLNNCRKGKSDLGMRAIDKILSFYQDLSKQWLIAGAGEMLVQNNASNSNNTVMGHHSALNSHNNDGETMQIILRLTKMLEQERTENARLRAELEELKKTAPPSQAERKPFN